MKTYIQKPKSIKISKIKSINSYSIKSHLEIKITNWVLLNDILEKTYINSNIKSGYYYSGSNYFLVSNKALTHNILPNSNNYIGVTPKGFSTKDKCPIQVGDILIGNNGTLGQIGYVKEDFNGITNSNITLLRFKSNIDSHYFLGIFYSKWFKDYCNTISTKSGTQEFITREKLKNSRIPIPSKKTHQEPRKIENFISLITQNIIDKEEQIKIKNQLIDGIIEKELRENQKNNELKYRLPRISEIRGETRLDTGVYGEKYKDFESILLGYSNGYYYLNPSKISPGVTPKDYHFSNIKRNKTFKNWITPKNIERRQISFNTYIHTKTKSKVKKNNLVLNGIRYVGNGTFAEEDNSIYSNQNTLIINQFDDKEKQLFLFCFLTSKIGKDMQIIRRNFGIVPILYTKALCKIPIPSFNELKQQEIVKEYYNKVDRSTNLNFENYLEKERGRNKELGIFQLNMELFSLREVLEDLIDKIIMDKPIDISFEY